MNPVQPVRDAEGAPISSSTDPAREAQSRDRLAPPSTRTLEPQALARSSNVTKFVEISA